MIRRSFPVFTPSANSPRTRATAAGLAPYSGPWDRRRAAHLVRRSSLGAIQREVDRALNDGSATVSRLIATALSDPLPETPSWYSRSGSTGTEEIYDLQRTWLETMRGKGLIEKMTLFWHHHFVTQWTANAGKASNSVGHLTYDYYKLLRRHALGNFRTLVYHVGLNPACGAASTAPNRRCNPAPSTAAIRALRPTIAMSIARCCAIGSACPLSASRAS